LEEIIHDSALHSAERGIEDVLEKSLLRCSNAVVALYLVDLGPTNLRNERCSHELSLVVNSEKSEE